MKNWVPVAGILPALVPGMVEAALVTLREYGTKSFAEVVQPAIELADGFPIDEMRVNAIVNSVKYLEAWPDSKRTFLPNGRPRQPGDIFRQPDLARTLRAMADAEKTRGRRRRQSQQGHRRRARFLLPRRNRPPHRRVLQGAQRPAPLRRHGRLPRRTRGTGLHHLQRLHGLQARLLEPGPEHARGAQHSGRLRHPGAEAELRGIHPHPGGSAQACVRRPRYLLRRSQVQQDSDRDAAQSRSTPPSGAS